VVQRRRVQPGPPTALPVRLGISYTRFRLDDLQLSQPEVPLDGALEISATVTNSGDRTGSEVVQLYLGDPVAEVTRPLKQLTGYAKVRLAPGERARVMFEVHADRTSFTGLDLQRVVEPGEITVMVGSSAEDLALRSTFTLVGNRRAVGEGRVLVTPARVSSPVPALT
jgi:hypothetical protein